MDVGFSEAVKITSAGDEKIELLGKTQVFAPLFCVMGAVVRLDTPEPGLLEPFDKTAEALGIMIPRSVVAQANEVIQ